MKRKVQLSDSLVLRQRNKRPNNTASTFDQFYTKDSIAVQCVDWLRETLDFTNKPAPLKFVEPSVGRGAFVKALRSRFGDLLPIDAMDICTTDEYTKLSFFDYEPRKSEFSYVVVGNPPFGVKSSLAVRFFNHAAAFASVIAFIMPKTFERPQYVNSLDSQFHLLASRAMPDHSFTHNDESRHVPTIFMVWERREHSRSPIDLGRLTSPLFTWTRDVHQADICIQRVGIRAGQVFVDRAVFAKYAGSQSFYFLTFSASLSPEMRERFRRFDGSRLSSRQQNAAMPSISKRDLVTAIEHYLANSNR